MARIAGVVAPACPPLVGLSASGGFPVPRSLFPIPDVAFSQQVMHNGVCASVHVKSRQKPSNSCQNRSKRRRFPSKSDQKRAHFVMPILTFGGWTPSGASARADFAFRKGKKARFGGAKWRPEKLSTITWRFCITPPGCGSVAGTRPGKSKSRPGDPPSAWACRPRQRRPGHATQIRAIVNCSSVAVAPPGR